MNFLEKFKKALENFYTKDENKKMKKINNLTINI